MAPAACGWTCRGGLVKDLGQETPPEQPSIPPERQPRCRARVWDTLYAKGVGARVARSLPEACLQDSVSGRRRYQAHLESETTLANLPPLRQVQVGHAFERCNPIPLRFARKRKETNSPSGERATTSVKVPPRSIPMIHLSSSIDGPIISNSIRSLHIRAASKVRRFNVDI